VLLLFHELIFLAFVRTFFLSRLGSPPFFDGALFGAVPRHGEGLLCFFRQFFGFQAQGL
jgi:hypothetical protein